MADRGDVCKAGTEVDGITEGAKMLGKGFGAGSRGTPEVMEEGSWGLGEEVGDGRRGAKDPGEG